MARCPRCGEEGSLQRKSVLNHQKVPYFYWFFAHSHGRGHLTWCYIGKVRPVIKGTERDRKKGTPKGGEE
jgi:hypothetical protein